MTGLAGIGALVAGIVAGSVVAATVTFEVFEFYVHHSKHSGQHFGYNPFRQV